MISRTHRFHGQSALLRVYKNGKTTRGSFMIVKCVPNKRDSYRLAVVVSKKVHKSAVQRNRIRRRLYEAVRRIESEIVLPTDIVITVFDEKIGTLPPEELHNLIRVQFAHAGLLQLKPNPAQA